MLFQIVYICLENVQMPTSTRACLTMHLQHKVVRLSRLHGVHQSTYLFCSLIVKTRYVLRMGYLALNSDIHRSVGTEHYHDIPCFSSCDNSWLQVMTVALWSKRECWPGPNCKHAHGLLWSTSKSESIRFFTRWTLNTLQWHGIWSVVPRNHEKLYSSYALLLVNRMFICMDHYISCTLLLESY